MKGKHRKIWRKICKDMVSLKEWSRMLHKWWKLNVVEKNEFKKNRE